MPSWTETIAVPEGYEKLASRMLGKGGGSAIFRSRTVQLRDGSSVRVLLMPGRHFSSIERIPCTHDHDGLSKKEAKRQSAIFSFVETMLANDLLTDLTFQEHEGSHHYRVTGKHASFCKMVCSTLARSSSESAVAFTRKLEEDAVGAFRVLSREILRSEMGKLREEAVSLHVGDMRLLLRRKAFGRRVRGWATLRPSTRTLKILYDVGHHKRSVLEPVLEIYPHLALKLGNVGMLGNKRAWLRFTHLRSFTFNGCPRYYDELISALKVLLGLCCRTSQVEAFALTFFPDRQGSEDAESTFGSEL